MTQAVILAGGKSSRFGRDKAFEKFGDSTLVESVFFSLKEIFSDIIIVTNCPENFSIFEAKTVKDIVPGRGPIGGIYTGLLSSSSQRIFAIACDMPFLDKDFIKYMISIKEGDVIVPRKEKDLYEPLHAVYSKNCLPYILDQLNKGDNKIQNFFSFVKTVYVEKDVILRFDTEMKMFFNINEKNDLKRFKTCIEK
ncbi:molybdenum cofactor guanylyltransferase [candidate division WOR-3 bacterium]|nr:molybdenum cofactor guanylyltransferase [candidate division WOR-3 bacterium]